MTAADAVATDAQLDALREDADLLPLIDALLVRGDLAIDRGDWSAALRDLEEAAMVATIAGQPERGARATNAMAVALRADGRLLAARRLLRA
jgi:hypothetical protein